jgi:translocation and assembly module TamB
VTDPGPRSRWRRIGKYLLITDLVVLLLLAGLAWYTTTDSFQAMVRRRLIAELERVTGGRVELGGFHTIPFRLRVDVRNLTIHGLEKPGDVPYFHVDRLVAQVRLISVLGAEFGLSSVVLEHPVVHVVLYPDGTTNQPEPKLKSGSTHAVEDLFALSISGLDVRRGQLLWGNESIPLDFAANDISISMQYSLLHRLYAGNLLVGKANTRFQDYRPVAWTAEAHFALGRNRVEVSSLKATSGRSHLEASGHLENFRHPKIEGTYSTTLDLTEAAAIARRRELRAGILQTSGRGSWSVETFSSSGKFQLKDFAWREESISLQKLAMDAQFSVNPQRLTFSAIQARVFGGSVTGDADVSNWLTSPSTTKLAKGKKAAEQKGILHLRMKDLSAAELAAALSTQTRPLERMNLAGVAGGTVEARWNRSPHEAETEIALDVVPPRQVAPSQLPLTLHAHATYRAAPGELNVAELTASTRATQLRASGTLSTAAALKLAVATTNLNELRPILAAFSNSGRIPLTLHGQASFNGNATGRLSDVTLAGSLQMHDFETHIPRTSRTPERQLHWDSLVAEVQLSQHAFSARNGTVQRGSATINFDLNASLERGRFVDSSPFRARIDMRNVDLTEMLALAGYDYPVTGIMNLEVQAQGTRAEPRGTGHVQLANATISGAPVQHFTSDLRFIHGDAELHDIQLAYREARVTGDAGYNSSTRVFSLSLTGKNFDLAGVPQLQSTRVRVDGFLDFTATGSGTLEAPVINAAVHLRDLAFDHERAGDFNFDAITKGADLHLAGRSQFEHAELAIDGNVHLRSDWPSTVKLHFEHLDVDSLLRTYLQGHVTGHSAVAGDLELHGPLRKPRELSIAGNLSEFYADVENIKVRNNGPLRFTVSNQFLKIDQFGLMGEGTDLAANGSVQLNGEHQLDLHAQGSLNLKLIESFNPDFNSSGMVTVDLAVSGTLSRPIAQGRLQIAGGAIAYIDLPSALSDINGSLVFNQDRLQIENLTAHTGGGLVTFGGYATSHNRQVNFDLTLQGRDVRLRYPPGVSATATADAHWVGSNTSSTLSGDITITKLAVTPGFDFAAYIQRATQTATLPQTNPLLNRIRLDVHIVTTPELQMQTAVARLSGDADLRLRGTAAKPVLLGRADIIEGDVYFNGTKYRLERGDVSFTNPLTTTPVLDLQASTRVRDYDITVNLNGPPDKLRVNWRSEPPLPEGDIIALLALGRTQEESAQLQQSGNSQVTQEASNAILAEALNATLSNRVQRLFGVSRIRIDPQGLSTETNPARGPQVTIEQQVANNLTLTYSTNVSQASQQIIQVEYNLTRNVSVIAIRDQNGVVSFDVRIRQRKK